MKYLQETEASFYTNILPSLRTYRVVMLSLSTLNIEIITALAELEHSVKTHLMLNEKKISLPLFSVDVHQQDTMNLRDITSLLNTKVVFGKPHIKR